MLDFTFRRFNIKERIQKFVGRNIRDRKVFCGVGIREVGEGVLGSSVFCHENQISHIIDKEQI